MSINQRVVLRSSWPAAFANTSPILLVFLVLQITNGSVAGAVTVLVVIPGVTVVIRQLQFVELTPEGLDIHLLGMRRVAWQDISSVELVDRWGGQSVRIHDAARRRGRYLRAPRGSFGVGKNEVAAARDLIEQWWQAYSNRPLPIVSHPSSPPAAPGGPNDPWRAPAED